MIHLWCVHETLCMKLWANGAKRSVIEVDDTNHQSGPNWYWRETVCVTKTEREWKRCVDCLSPHSNNSTFIPIIALFFHLFIRILHLKHQFINIEMICDKPNPSGCIIYVDWESVFRFCLRIFHFHLNCHWQWSGTLEISAVIFHIQYLNGVKINHTNTYI